MKSEYWKQLGALVVLAIISVVLVTYAMFPKEYKGKKLEFEQITSLCTKDWCAKEGGGKTTIEANGLVKPVDREKWENFVNELKLIDTNISLSENKVNFENYGIEEERYVEIDGKRVWIGEVSEDLSNTYIAIDGKVYKSGITWDNEELLKESYWINSTLTNEPVYQIQKIILENKDQAQEIVFDKNKPPEYLNTLAYIMGVEWLNDKSLTKVSENLKIILDSGERKKQISVGEAFLYGKKVYWGKDESGYYDIGKEVFSTIVTIN